MSTAEYTAKFPIPCEECGEKIKKGEKYRLLPDLVTAHVVCPGEEKRPVCPVCSLELPLSGECCDPDDRHVKECRCIWCASDPKKVG